MEETVDLVFRSTGDNNFEPRGVGDRLSQSLQEDWASLVITTFVECVNDKDESVFWVARKVADEIKEHRSFHGLWCQIWVATETVCDDVSKGGEFFGEFEDESRKDVSDIARIRVIPLAEEPSGEPLCIVKPFTDGVSQRRFANSW